MKLKFFGLAAIVLLSGCITRPYTPVVDGPRDAQYESDLAACRALANEASGQGNEIARGAAGGAAVGAIIGSLSGNVGDGAAAGASVGAVRGISEKEQRERQVISNCMRGRGHNVVG